MKSTVSQVLVGMVAALMLVASALAQSGGYEVKWFTLGGGGGTVSGGAYTISGTVGQPDAGSLSGASYAIQGGFWRGVGSLGPVLRITYAGPDVTLSWPDSFTGFQLQETLALRDRGTPWSNVGQAPVVAGGKNLVTLPTTGARRFFRLCRP